MEIKEQIEQFMFNYLMDKGIDAHEGLHKLIRNAVEECCKSQCKHCANETPFWCFNPSRHNKMGAGTPLCRAWKIRRKFDWLLEHGKVKTKKVDFKDFMNG